jgi:hypothetical protein
VEALEQVEKTSTTVDGMAQAVADGMVVELNRHSITQAVAEAVTTTLHTSHLLHLQMVQEQQNKLMAQHRLLF